MAREFSRHKENGTDHRCQKHNRRADSSAGALPRLFSPMLLIPQDIRRRDAQIEYHKQQKLRFDPAHSSISSFILHGKPALLKRSTTIPASSALVLASSAYIFPSGSSPR